MTTHSNGDRIACPHCGEWNRDLWDYGWSGRESIETECGHCSKPFVLTRHMSVSYSATAVNPTALAP